FFFSSRRRHTRWPRDWSSDVCSSDLAKTWPPSRRLPVAGGVAFSMVARSSQRGPRRPRRATRPAARGGGRDLRNGRPDALGDLFQRVGEREADLEVLALEARQHAVGCNTDPELAGGRKDRRLPL